MATKNIKHKTKVEAAQAGFFFGDRNQHIINELRAVGIPAVAQGKSIGVERGTLDVYEENGGRVFDWKDAEEEIKTEVVDEAQQAPPAEEEQPSKDKGKGKGKK